MSKPRNQRTRRNTRPQAVKPKPGPEALYAFSDFPAPNTELTLFAAKARVDVVLVPSSVTIDNIYSLDEESGVVEYFDRFNVSGLTDRGEHVSFTARTKPDSEDIFLETPLSFDRLVAV